jgi:hypothetical protein
MSNSTDANYGHRGNEGPEHVREHKSGPYWRRAHRDIKFWIALVLMFAAIAIYVLSDDLAFLPHHQP